MAATAENVANVKALACTDVDGAGTDGATLSRYFDRTRTLTFPLMIVDVINTAQENFLWQADKDCTVLSVSILPGVAMTAHDTNYKTLTLKTEDAAASAVATLGTLNTKATGGTGNWAAGVPEVMTLSTVAINATEVVVLDVAVAAAGIVIGPYTLQMVIQYD